MKAVYYPCLKAYQMTKTFFSPIQQRTSIKSNFAIVGLKRNIGQRCLSQNYK